jgi:hypothetical protein
MPEGFTGVTITRCILTTYPAEQEKAAGFSPPTPSPARRDEAQALSAGRGSAMVDGKVGH